MRTDGDGRGQRLGLRRRDRRCGSRRHVPRAQPAGRTLLADGLNPDSVETVRTYCFGANEPCAMVPNRDGRLDLTALKAALNDGVACLILQSRTISMES